MDVDAAILEIHSLLSIAKMPKILVRFSPVWSILPKMGLDKQSLQEPGPLANPNSSKFLCKI
jgi:hypothetical protein